MQKFLLIFILGLVFSCTGTSSKKASKSTAKADVLNVDFSSIGSGADGNSMRKLEQLMSKFEKKENLKFDWTKKHYGMEGETSYSIPMNKLDSTQKAVFLEQVEKITKEGNFIRFYYSNSP